MGAGVGGGGGSGGSLTDERQPKVWFFPLTRLLRELRKNYEVIEDRAVGYAVFEKGQSYRTLSYPFAHVHNELLSKGTYYYPRVTMLRRRPDFEKIAVRYADIETDLANLVNESHTGVR